MQPELLARIDDIIVSAMDKASEMGLLVPKRIPYRQLQAFMLTSNAFMGLSATEAGEIMGIDAHTVNDHVYEISKDSACVQLFNGVWKSDGSKGSLTNPLRFDETIDESKIVRKF